MKDFMLFKYKKYLIGKLLITGLMMTLSMGSQAQKMVEQYREKFSESYPIRKEQHLEIKAYIDKLVEERIHESLNAVEPDFFSIENYISSLHPYRQKLGEYLGYPPPKAIEGVVSKFEKAGEDKYSVIYRVWIEVIDDVHTYGIFMVPKKLKGKDKAPLIIAIHGGGGNPEAICDLDTRINYHSFGHEAVKRGYIVWAPGLTMLSGYGGDPAIPGASRELLDRQLKALGSTIIGLEIHKIIESTKVLINERSEIDANNVGMTGLSWGGFFTMYTTALCPFIKAAAPSAYLRDTKAELEKALNTDTRSSQDYALNGLGHFQAIGLICPRPCMVQLGEKDGLFDMDGARNEAKRAAQFYERLGVGDRFIFNTHPDGHEFENESIFRFFDKYLK
jgi:predicted esterase